LIYRKDRQLIGRILRSRNLAATIAVLAGSDTEVGHVTNH
jgi:hypothetical protein